MHEQITVLLGNYPPEVVSLFHTLRKLIYDSIPDTPEEKLWAKLPSYYVGEAFVRLIPFKDHINIEASAAAVYQDALAGYKFTPKGMLQIYVRQAVPDAVLTQVLRKSLLGEFYI